MVGELKVATVEIDNSDNMATLPVSRGNDSEKCAALKEMELKGVQPKPDKRYPDILESRNLTRIIKFCANLRRNCSN